MSGRRGGGVSGEEGRRGEWGRQGDSTQKESKKERVGVAQEAHRQQHLRPHALRGQHTNVFVVFG